MSRRFSAAALLLLAQCPSASGQFEFKPGGFEFADPEGFDPLAASEELGPMVSLSARYAPSSGETPAMVEVTADIAEGYHVYSITQPPGGPQPTVLRLDESAGVRLAGPWVATPSPKTHVDEVIWVGLTIEEHYDKVTWRAPIDFAAGVDPATANVSGSADLQACTETTCHALDGESFVAERVAPGSIDAPQVDPLGDPTLPPNIAATANAASASADAIAIGSLLPILGAAFLGGLILNLMPCVLPVIGLKVLSFAEQAGHDRGKVLAMNVAYTAGLMSVFLLLAGLAAFASYGWGELYTITEFKVGMIVLVFAMALSFLGVWEIPLPGFAGGRGANELQQKEGYSGAFFKGVFTTILATPCSGPFLGSAIGVTLSQPAWVTFLIFGTIGLGMASPYLLIGVFPSLVKSLPKPGAWMETFKQLMGFVLMGTVVYLISTVSTDAYLPVLTTLVAVGLACWWIGTTPITSTTGKKAQSWLGGVGISVATGVAAFALLGPSEHDLPWKPYSKAALANAKTKGGPVLVDFTADWCLTCKLNLKRAINTERVREVVAANSVTPLLADWTDKNEEIKQTLESLGSRSIPLLAIDPAGESEPILLRDLISEEQLLEALADAGAVRANEASVSMPEIEIGEVASEGTFR
ncbi:MAG: thioredoxin family protein [Planctomycetota bacterium]